MASDIFGYNKFSSKMSNFLVLAQAIFTTVVFAQGVTTAVLKKQIETLVQKYKPEFECINKLYEHIQKLAVSKLLISQLRASMTFSTDQWTALASDLDNRKVFFDTLKGKMEKINLPSEENKWSDYTTVLFEGIAAIGLWNLAFKENHIAGVVEKIKEWYRAIRVYLARPRVQPLPNQQFQLVEINQVLKDIREVQAPQEIEQNNQRPEACRAQVWNAITLGFHIVLVVGLCIGVVAGAVDIDQLRQEKKKLDEAFGPNGDFKQVEEGVIELMKFVSINMYQISNTSKCVLNDLSRLFLTKSVLTPKYFDVLYQNAVKLRPFEFGVTDDYIIASEKFMSAVVDKGNSKDSNPDKLYGIQKLYDDFMTTQKPGSIMGNIAQVVSQTIGKFSLASGQIDEYNNINYRFLHQACNAMAERNVKILNEKTDAGRKQLDISYLKFIVDCYNQLFKEEPIDLASLNLKSKDLLYYTVGLFSNNFYYDDNSGKTLFTLEFSKISQLKTYGDIFKDYEENPPKYIKISYTDANQETAAQNEYIAQVKKLSNDKNSTVHPLYRYVTYVNVDNPGEKDEQKKKYVKSIEGMKYTLNNDAATIKSIEKDFQNQSYYLVA